MDIFSTRSTAAVEGESTSQTQSGTTSNHAVSGSAGSLVCFQPARSGTSGAVPLPSLPLLPSSYEKYDDPDDLARERRLDWAALLKRTHLIDVLVCPKCTGPMRLIAVIQDERVARRILEHLGLWSSRAPPRSERPSRSGESELVLGLDAIDPQFVD